MPWNKAVEAVRTRRFDAIQGMAISTERLKTFDFSEEYLVVSQCIFVSKAQMGDIQKLEDLKGLKVAIQKGDMAYELINCKLESPKTSLHYVLVEDQEEAILQLIDGRVDAFIGNQLTGTFVAERLGKSSEIFIVGEPISPKTYAIAVTKGRKNLIDLFNHGLLALKKNGIYDEICAKWFGKISSDIGNQILENVAAGVIGINKLGTIVSINSYAKKFLRSSISPLRMHYLETALHDFIDPILLQETLTKALIAVNGFLIS